MSVPSGKLIVADASMSSQLLNKSPMVCRIRKQAQFLRRTANDLVSRVTEQPLVHVVNFQVTPRFEVRNGNHVRTGGKRFRKEFLRRAQGIFSSFALCDVHIHADKIRFTGISRDFENSREAPT